MAEPAPSLHILIVGAAWPPETFIARLISGILTRGVIVTVACARRPDPEWMKIRNFHWLPVPGWEGNRVGRLIRLGLAYLRSLLSTPSELRRLSVALRSTSGRITLDVWNKLLPIARKRWDVIYFPWNSAAIAGLPLFEMRIPVVLSCRGSQVNIAPYNPRRAEIRAGLLSTFQKAAAVHCVSQDILHQAQILGLDPAKARVIHPAVDPYFFIPSQSMQQENGAFRVVSTGSLIWRKGYEYALSAVRLLKDMGVPVRYQIIGDGPDRQRLLYTIRDLGLENEVQLLGNCLPSRVRDILQQADAFLLSSLSEGISNAVLEAMSCGLPVVTTNCGGMREAVTDGVEGLVVPVRDPQAMADALLILARNADLRKELGSAGRQRVIRDFPLDVQIDAFMDFYRKTLEPVHG